MRYKPIEHPTGLIMRIASRIVQKRFGKLISPMTVIYARKLPLLFLTNRIEQYTNKKLVIPSELVCLIKAYGSMLNGCSFCNDLALAEAIKKQLGTKKFINLSNWEENGENNYTPGERAVLRFIKEYTDHKWITDEMFTELNEYFSEQQVIDIVTVNAIEQFYNALNIPFGISSNGLADLQSAGSTIVREGTKF